MEAEAVIVIYFYVGIALVLICTVIIVLSFVWFKKVMEDTNIFVRLMIGLYEQEKQRNERKDEGGFGT
jgi:hypothetical protein